MGLFRLISEFFWLLCLGTSLFNYVVARRRIASAANGEEAARLLKWVSVLGALPWVLMGIGYVSGFTPTVWYYFRPQDLNPFVLLWLASIFVEVLVYAIWVLFMDGARKVREYELLGAIGMRTKAPMSERLIKVIAAVGPPFVLLWIWVVISSNAQLPK